MINRLFSTHWGHESLQDLIYNLPSGFTVSIRKSNGKSIESPNIKCNEKFVEYITINYGDQFEIIQFSKSNLDFIHYKFQAFIDKHAPKTPQPVNIDELREMTLDDIKTILKIDNDHVDYDNKQMTFELNLYNPRERAIIIAFLAAIDQDVPDILINVNLNTSSLEQLNALRDRVLEAEITK